jgi:hypothetical protein
MDCIETRMIGPLLLRRTGLNPRIAGLLLAFAPCAVATAEAQTTDPRVADL